MPNIIYTEGLEGVTPGNAVPGWTPLSGVFVAQNAAGSARPVTGNMATLTQATNGNTALYTAMTPIADVDFQSSHIVKVLTSNVAINHHIHRASYAPGDTTLQNGYRIAILYSAGNYTAVLLKVVAGAATNLGGGTGSAFAVTNGDTVLMATSSVGTAHALYLWKTGSRPGSPQYVWTDAAVTAAGIVGFLSATSTGDAGSSDDLIITDLSSAAATSLLPPPRGRYFNNLLSV